MATMGSFCKDGSRYVWTIITDTKASLKCDGVTIISPDDKDSRIIVDYTVKNLMK